MSTAIIFVALTSFTNLFSVPNSEQLNPDSVVVIVESSPLREPFETLVYKLIKRKKNLSYPNYCHPLSLGCAGFWCCITFTTLLASAILMIVFCSQDSSSAACKGSVASLLLPLCIGMMCFLSCCILHENINSRYPLITDVDREIEQIQRVNNFVHAVALLSPEQASKFYLKVTQKVLPPELVSILTNNQKHDYQKKQEALFIHLPEEVFSYLSLFPDRIGSLKNMLKSENFLKFIRECASSTS